MFLHNILDRLFKIKSEKQAEQNFQSNNNRKTILILLIVFVFLLSSCSIFSKENKKETKPDQENPEMSIVADAGATELIESTAKPIGESSVLRIYWQARDDYNPLNTFDYSGRAAYQLMHRSIFKVNKANLLSMDLARSASYIADKNLYQIELVPGITYSDGTLITARDCAASILQYKANLSKYFAVEESAKENSEIEPEQTKNQQMEPKQNLAEIMHKYPDLLPVNNDLLTQHDEDFVSVETLIHELDRLSLINEVKAVGDLTLEISLRDPDDESSGNDADANNQTLENDEMLDITEENNKETPGNTESLDDIDNTENTGDSEKRIYYEKDPGLLFGLTMPIIPENLIATTSLPTITSGKYLVERNEQGNVSLRATDSDFVLQKIQLIAFPDIKSAMTAFVENKLDFIYLNESNYNIFCKQNNANILSFPGQRYYYLSFGNGETVNIPEIKKALINIWEVRDDLTSTLTGDQSSNRLPLQYNDQAISAFNLFEQQSDRLEVQTIHELNNKDIRLKVIVADSTLERSWAFALREKLLDTNIKLELEYIEPDLYQTALEQGDYDLAFNQISLFYPMNILDVFEQIKPSVMETLTENEAELYQEISDYFYSVNRKIDPKILNEKNKAYRDFINQKFSELDILGIGFAPVGIFLAKNIEGSSESHLAEPYLGLEDLWVWQ
ncbi:MAG TPA: hypothetical protein GXZ76_06355 [Clostridiaceae bacterium]|nr:hypothetical protein [Clostridiaceae bacterium]